MKQYAVIYTMLDIQLNAEVRPAHVEYLTTLLREGKIVDGMKFPDYYVNGVQGILVCKAGSKDEVGEWFAKDPVVMAGARTFEVREFQPMSIKC